MGKNTSIEWTDHTFNPWWGCEKVSPGCAHCYADTFARRLGHGGTKPPLWGPGSERRMFGDKHWAEPLAWDRAAAEAGTRARVFCASMADVFEDRPELAAPRARLFGLILATPNLDWLLLTKRPENADRLWRAAHRHDYEEWAGDDAGQPGPTWRPNVWLGTTVEDQRRAVERLPHLIAVPAAVRFLSCEPLLGPVDLRRWLHDPCNCWVPAMEGAGQHSPKCRTFVEPWGIDWVIAGGESGHGARPMHPDWARLLRDQCADTQVPFLFKQWGDWADLGHAHELVDKGMTYTTVKNSRVVNSEGGQGFHGTAPRLMRRVGKGVSGRQLDGREHDAFPEGWR